MFGCMPSHDTAVAGRLDFIYRFIEFIPFPLRSRIATNAGAQAVASFSPFVSSEPEGRRIAKRLSPPLAPVRVRYTACRIPRRHGGAPSHLAGTHSFASLD